MKTKPILWLDEAPIAEIDGDGVKITSKSGGLVDCSRMSRASFRRFVEVGIRMLDAADRGNQGKVCVWKKRRDR